MGGSPGPKNSFAEDPRRDRRRSIRMGPDRGLRKPNVKVAEEAAEFETAFRLVHDVYVDMGYAEPHPSGLRATLHQLVPSTLVFLAREETLILGTVSLIFDDPGGMGLPMSALYQEELDRFREQGLRLAEVSALAVDSQYRWLLIDEEGKRRGLFWLLHQAVLYYARQKEVDHLVITVNPRHVPFYERLYLFERFGEVKPYDSVRGAPAVPLQLDLNRLPERLDRAMRESDRMFGLGRFFFRLEHGFFRGEERLPSLDPATAWRFAVEGGALARAAPSEADAFARVHGFADVAAFRVWAEAQGRERCETSEPS
ncbi:N-acyl amino acid synthase FeeM domain-containing protein [Deferrisoma camini]|uniref:N-acyl amino acid synthase FeeM domain-containing protein n=1 Tax=Deferrisoma camini TaxID=1035120 RepID=UPI00046C9B19|nr:hypothetical protein [Deferrisoma camini]